MSDLPPPVPVSVQMPSIEEESDEMESLPGPPRKRISEKIESIEPFTPRHPNVPSDANVESTVKQEEKPKPNPFAALGGGKPSLGGLMMGINGANKLLKASRRATTFVLKEGSKLAGNHKDWCITPTERMRSIDELRKHMPTSEECDVLNIPTDRLFVDNIKDVLYLSGGCAGVRFTTAELKSLQALVLNIHDLVKNLEKTYAKLSPDQTKLNINPSGSEKIDRNDDYVASNMKIMYFHGVADNLIQLISELQVIVHEKQKLIDKTATKMKFENDPDNIPGGMPRPRWLEILMTKCDAYLNPPSTSTNINESEASSSSRKKPVTKGKLASFVSFLCLSALPCTEDEQAALEEVNFYNELSIAVCMI